MVRRPCPGPWLAHYLGLGRLFTILLTQAFTQTPLVPSTSPSFHAHSTPSAIFFLLMRALLSRITWLDAFSRTNHGLRFISSCITKSSFHPPSAKKYPRPGHWSPDNATTQMITSILRNRGWHFSNLNSLQIKLNESYVTQMLNHVFDESSDASLAFYFFRWSRRHNGSRHGIRAVCAMIHISILGNMNNLAMDFLRGIAKNADGREDWHGFIFEVLRETSRDPGVLEIVYSMLVGCYVRLNMIETAIKLVSRMKNLNLFPSRGVFNSLLSVLLESKQVDAAQELLMDMESVSIELVSLFIQEECADDRFDCACELLFKMQNNGEVDIVAYTIIIDALCKRGRLNEAGSLLCRIIHAGITPDSVLLASLVDGYCEAGRFAEAKCLLNSSDCVRDVFLYNSEISMLCNTGSMFEAYQLLNEMFESGMCPDSHNYSTVIGGYCEESEMNQALKVFAQMLKRGTKATVSTYTLLIKGYCKLGDIQGAEDIFSAMERVGLQPDIVTYKVLMTGYSMKGDMHKLYNTMGNMIKNGLSLDVAMYKNILMHGLVKKGSLTKSREIFEDLDRRGFSPDKFAFTNVIDIYSKEGNVRKTYGMWCRMSRDGVKPDVVTCSALLNGFCNSRSDLMQDAMFLFNKMVDDGLEPDVVLFNTLIWGFCRKGDSDEACKLLTMMATMGVAPNYVTRMALVHALKRNGVENARAIAHMKFVKIFSRRGVVSQPEFLGSSS